MTGRRALILAGTGMLADVAEALVIAGWHVVLPSRRYSPIAVPETKAGIAALRALRPPGHVRLAQARPDAGKPGRAIWVEASWDRPGELARKAGTALEGRADLLVAWVHGEYRQAVMAAVEPLLAPQAPVVEVWVCASERVGCTTVEPSLPAHQTQIVLLGQVSEADGDRALGHSEIAEGVLVAVDRALAGHLASVHQIGHVRPMVW